MLKLNKILLKGGIIKHNKIKEVLKDMIESGHNWEDDKVVGAVCAYVKTGRELALAEAELKCEKTGSGEDLQFHHLIERPNRKLMSKLKYVIQRNYYANIVILSQEAHEHNSYDKGEGVISKKTLDKAKKLYFDEVTDGI